MTGIEQWTWPPDPGASAQAVALAHLAELTRQQERLAGQRDQAVSDAVAIGVGWGLVGRATGLTRQGARQRWHGRLPEPREVAHDSAVPAENHDVPADVEVAGSHILLETPVPRLAAYLFALQAGWDDPPDDPWGEDIPLAGT
ncbi:hypothetical protein MXD61_15300 [Frankia sp. AgPm24]|uniref:hypothetical protein n=1 Tax=Frankia sp. AgPm24 TaxID=631128 RepID=UPI00201087F0|nr:hypothetical protein [Frankia sp. AgPm24]MCK9923220.1 hypothetical protein [Frankia sp. AgPm24]